VRAAPSARGDAIGLIAPGLDETTAVLMCSIVIVVIASLFVARVAFLGATPTGRIWTLSAGAVVFFCIAANPWRSTDAIWWSEGVARASLLLAFGGIWSGFRAYNGRAARLPAVVACSLSLVLVTVLTGPLSDGTAATALYHASLPLACALIVFEIARPDSRAAGRLDGRIGGVLTGGLLAVYLVRLALSLTAGADSAVFLTAFGPIPEMLLLTVFTCAVAITGAVLLSLEDASEHGGVRMSSGATFRASGILGRTGFVGAAAGWLRRSEHAGETSVLLVVEVDDLASARAAHGRAAGDRITESLAATLVGAVPAASLVGYLADGRFAILCPAGASESWHGIADIVRAAVLDAALDDIAGTPAVASIGGATTEDAGFEIETLIEAATRSFERARRRDAVPAGSTGGVRAATDPRPHGRRSRRGEL